jgi:GNAT superfamily N-acetyltransferase
LLPPVADIERAGLKAWPGLEAEYDGAWVRRAANGYTKRANSVQALDPADDRDAAARLEASVRWFTARGLKPVFRITPLAGPGIHAALDDAGWSRYDRSALMAMPLEGVEPDPRGMVLAATDPLFLDAQQELQGYDDGRRQKLEAIIRAVQLPLIGVVVRNDAGDPVASGLMDVADGIFFAGNVVTAAAERGKGYGKAMMRTGLAWAARQGARFAALNVLADNAPAIALYQSLGYRYQYDYCYCSPVAA